MTFDSVAVGHPGAEPRRETRRSLQELEPIVEARIQTVGEFLGELFPRRDIDAGLKRVQTFVENLTEVVERAVMSGREMVERLDKLPPAPGYEPY